ncbi:MAG: C39 family peptidase [Candidatus Daviesbacteria bacterium]|nr:C39 family peptidase [Candidatus Daviesbacteria bacterium]
MVKVLSGLVILLLISIAAARLVQLQEASQPSLDGLLVSATISPTPESKNTPITTRPLSRAPTPSSSVTTTIPYKSKVLISGVPFTVQAPTGDWKDARFQEGCEEASSLMAVYWAKNLSLNRDKALAEIIAMAAYQQEKWGEARDTSTHDTALRIISGYFNFGSYEIKEDMSLNDMKNELLNGHLLIIPANGRALKNPHFTAPGPDRHMIVVRGYDDNTGTFITNDPGIREGELYTYPQQLFYDAIRDYPSGFNLPIEGDKKIMIVIKKS